MRLTAVPATTALLTVDEGDETLPKPVSDRAPGDFVWPRAARGRSSDRAQLTQDGGMIEVHLLANQVVALKNKDQHTLYFHALSRRFNACPDASLSPSEPGLYDDGIVGMMERNLVEVEVGERRNAPLTNAFTASAPSTIAPKAGTS